MDNEEAIPKVIDVVSYGNVFGGEGFKSGRRMYVKDHDNNWFSTNNRDWEPECPILPSITFNIVTTKETTR